jgi:hypothetical protein
LSSGAPDNSNWPPGSSETVGVVGQADDMVALHHRAPAETLQAGEQRLDAARPGVRRGRQVVAAEHEFLVLGADAPLRRRFAAGGEVLDELTAIGDASAARCDWA